MIIKKQDLKEYFEDVETKKTKDINEHIQSVIDYEITSSLQYDSIKINDIVKIIGFYGKPTNYNSKIDITFNSENNLLLSLASDLDDYFYDTKTFLWNELVLNENNKEYYNTTTEYTQGLEFLFYDIETEIENNIDNLFDNPLCMVNVEYFIQNFEFKDLIDTEKLKQKIETSIIKLMDLINDAINNYFENDYQKMIMDIELNVLNSIEHQVNYYGYYEGYI